MENLLVIDGYNCMKRTRAFEKELDASLERARRAFLEMVKKFSRKNHTYGAIMVVFDGKGDIDSHPDRDGSASVIFSTRGESADEVIRRLLEKYAVGRRISVVSDDNYVTNHARAYGADVIACSDFLRLIQRGVRTPEAIDEKGLDAGEAAAITEALRKVWTDN